MVEIASGQNIRASQEPFFRSVWPDGWGETRHKVKQPTEDIVQVYYFISNAMRRSRILVRNGPAFHPGNKLPEIPGVYPKLNCATEVGNIAFCPFLWIFVYSYPMSMPTQLPGSDNAPSWVVTLILPCHRGHRKRAEKGSALVVTGRAAWRELSLARYRYSTQARLPPRSDNRLSVL